MLYDIRSAWALAPLLGLLFSCAPRPSHPKASAAATHPVALLGDTTFSLLSGDAYPEIRLALSPSGRRLALLGACELKVVDLTLNETISSWRLDGGSTCYWISDGSSMAPPRNGVGAVAFTSNEDALLVARPQGGLLLYPLSSAPRRIALPRMPEAPPRRLEASPRAGRFLLTTARGTWLGDLHGDKFRRVGDAATFVGDSLITAEGRDIKIDGTLFCSLPFRVETLAALSPRSLLILAEDRQRLIVADLLTGALEEFYLPEARALNPNVRAVFARVEGARAELVDLKAGSLLTLSHPGDISDLILSPDGGTLYLAGAGQVTVWDAYDGYALRPQSPGRKLLRASFLPQENALLVQSAEGTLSLYDLASQTLRERWNLPETSLLRVGKKRIYLIDQTIYPISLDGKEATEPLFLWEKPLDARISKDEKTLWILVPRGVLCLPLNPIPSGAPLRAVLRTPIFLRTGEDPFLLAPDGETTVSRRRDGEIEIHKPDGSILLLKNAQKATTYDLHAQGEILSASWSNGTIQIFETQNGKEIARLGPFPCHPANGCTVSLSPDKSRLAIVGRDAVYLADLESRKILQKFPEPLRLGAVFSPKGDQLALYGDGPGVSIYQIKK